MGLRHLNVESRLLTLASDVCMEKYVSNNHQLRPNSHGPIVDKDFVLLMCSSIKDNVFVSCACSSTVLYTLHHFEYVVVGMTTLEGEEILFSKDEFARLSLSISSSSSDVLVY